MFVSALARGNRASGLAVVAALMPPEPQETRMFVRKNTRKPGAATASKPASAKTRKSRKTATVKKPGTKIVPKNERHAGGTRQHDNVPPAKPYGVTPSSKLATVIAMLLQAGGTTIAELSKATGWQAHSVRGALSGALKKKLGLTIVSEKTDGVRNYRIAD
jgi:hypothetical protein